MGSFSLVHWIIVLLIVAMVFGTKKLRNIGEDLGGAIRGFKQGMKDGTEGQAPQAPSDGKTIEGQASEKKN